MKIRVGAFLLLCLVLCFTLPNMIQPALGQEPVVRAVFFYSPSCGHCHLVRTEIFPPLKEQYGEQLDILEIDASTPDGQVLYEESTEVFNIPDNRQGVPRLIVGDTVMVGSREIPEQFPVLVEQSLAAGGIGWPAITGLDDFV
ncbi:MAG: vitamin K epoxide reductase, partial [Anaerolineae bacterium]|nr:vitamin K epoxide reductase [Anaerolineae bacterium]